MSPASLAFPRTPDGPLAQNKFITNLQHLFNEVRAWSGFHANLCIVIGTFAATTTASSAHLHRHPVGGAHVARAGFRDVERLVGAKGCGRSSASGWSGSNSTPGRAVVVVVHGKPADYKEFGVQLPGDGGVLNEKLQHCAPKAIKEQRLGHPRSARTGSAPGARRGRPGRRPRSAVA